MLTLAPSCLSLKRYTIKPLISRSKACKEFSWHLSLVEIPTQWLSRKKATSSPGEKPLMGSWVWMTSETCLRTLMGSHISLTLRRWLHCKIRRSLRSLVERRILFVWLRADICIVLEAILVDNWDSLWRKLTRRRGRALRRLLSRRWLGKVWSPISVPSLVLLTPHQDRVRNRVNGLAKDK